MDMLDAALWCLGLLSVPVTVFGVVKFRRARAAEVQRERVRMVTFVAEVGKELAQGEAGDVEPGAAAAPVSLRVEEMLGAQPLDETGPSAASPSSGALSPSSVPPSVSRTLADDMADFFGPLSPASLSVDVGEDDAVPNGD